MYLRMKVCLTISLGLKSCDLCHCFAENEESSPCPTISKYCCLLKLMWKCPPYRLLTRTQQPCHGWIRISYKFSCNLGYN